MEIVKEIQQGNKIVKIFLDEYPESPREWDNLGKMICFHRRYNLGDKHEFISSDYSSWEDMERAISNQGYVAILPIYMYDHSGITISTNSFSCPWDSGQIGFICTTKEKIREAYNVKRITKNILEKVEKTLKGEVELYDFYLCGDVYGFRTFEDGEETDSCFGFYGDNFEENGLYDHAGLFE